MKKIILVNGLIAGGIASGLMLISFPLVENGTVSYDAGRLLGYASMVLAFSMIFAGIKTYRDKLLNGVISFGQACKTGLLITVVASLIYALTWDIYYRVSAGDFTENYTEHYLEKMRNEGASEEEIRSMETQMESFNTLYEDTFIRFGITLMEILPVGVAITLLSAAILRKGEVLRKTK